MNKLIVKRKSVAGIKPRVWGAWIIFPRRLEYKARDVCFMIFRREGHDEEEIMGYEKFMDLPIYRPTPLTRKKK